MKCKKREQLPTNKLCELSLLLNKKEGVEEQFPEVRENSLYEKLLNHLAKRELRGFGSTVTTWNNLLVDISLVKASLELGP